LGFKDVMWVLPEAHLNEKEPDNLICLNVSVNGYYYAKGTWNLDELNIFDGDGIRPI